MKQPVNNSLLWVLVPVFIPVMLAGAVRAATQDTPAAGPAFERPDTEVIRAHMEDLLADDYYQPRKSFLQHLRDFFFGRDLSLPSPGPGLGRFLFWAFLIWCCVTLIAILIHFIWSVIKMADFGKPVRRSAGAAAAAPEKSEAELKVLAREMAQAGNYYLAVTFLMLATLKRLDAKGLLRFHASKTNGDYLQDFPRETAGYPDFKTYVDIFEKSIYGRLIPERTAFEQMEPLAGRLDALEQR